MGEKLVNRLRIAGLIGDKPSRGAAVEEGHRLSGDVAEQILAQAGNDALAGALQHIGLEIRKYAADSLQQQIRDCKR